MALSNNLTVIPGWTVVQQCSTDLDALGAVTLVQDYPPIDIGGAAAVLTFASQPGSVYTVQL